MTYKDGIERGCAVSRRFAAFVTTTAVVTLLTSPGCDEYSPKEQDRDTLVGFHYFLNDDWNENVAGGPAGAIDYTVTGTDCGSLHVTGQFSPDDLSYALSYSFNRYCFSAGNDWRSVSIRSITGELSVSGFFQDQRVFTAAGLVVDGKARNDSDGSANLDGALDLDCTVLNFAGKGTVNGRDAVSWDYSDTSSSNASSGADCSVDCGSVNNGIEVTGAALQIAACGKCPSNTNQTGIDNVTANGPYYVCTCLGY